MMIEKFSQIVDVINKMMWECLFVVLVSICVKNFIVEF